MKYLLSTLAALLILASASMANAEEPAQLGRLFFTPSERSNFDILRQISKAPDKVIKADEISKDDDAATTPAPGANNPVIMNGYIRRSDGKNTLWVNDQALTEDSTKRDISVDRLNKGQVRITVNNKSASLKPGQAYDPNTGKIYNHVSDMPQPVADDDKKSESVVDTVAKKLGLDEFKSKVSELMDSLSTKPDATPPSDAKQ